jgi:1-aminocyclopropane-1-carboxylate deaminase/D-cysteine desulfhydrase-like pyridoxal-dependent ACC family enzyme
MKAPGTSTSALEAVRREPLVLAPTPLHEDPLLAKALGIHRPLLLKRDDLIGPALGGNKVRKLEYLLAAASSQGADCVVTVGAPQSNHARLAAVLGARAGFEVHLVLAGPPPDRWEGNLLLDNLAGAKFRFAETEDWDTLGRVLETTGKELESAGRKPYLIPIGGSTPVGVLGYLRCYLELSSQLDEVGLNADWVVHASSTGGTQAGLVAGRALMGKGPRVFGVEVAKGGTNLRERVHNLAGEALNILGVPSSIDETEILTSDFTGPAYGAVTDGAAWVLKTALRTSGLLTDPVYSAKGLLGLCRLASEGALAGNGALIFLHTGGQPALFDHYYAKQTMETGNA